MVGQDILNERRGALLLAIPALATVLAVLHHPTLKPGAGASQEQLAHGLQSLSAINVAFHIGVMLLTGVQALGLVCLAEAISLRGLWVRAGLIFYGLGTVLLFSAASIDGFAVAFLAERLDSTPFPVPSTLPATLVSLSAAIQGFTRGGLANQAVAQLLLSIAALIKFRSLRGPAVLGCLTALALLALPLLVGSPIGPRQLGLFTVIPAAWSIGAAACLWQGGFAPASPA